MALPFFSDQQKKRDQIVVVDLGTRVTKAIHLQRKGAGFSLAGYVLQEAPVYERNLTAPVLSEHLKKVMEPFGGRIKQVCVAIGVADCLLRLTEMPMVPVNDMRTMLKFGSKNYLQQDFPDHLFDCQMLPPKEAKMDATKAPPKTKVIVGGAKRAFIEEVVSAMKTAGLVPDMLVPSYIGPANAFEMVMPDIFEKEVIALVDIGYKNSTITILLSGELMLSRVVGFGSAKLTTGIAESMGITSAEAENVKCNNPQEVESTMQPLLTPLGRELRASIDFFEHQNDKTVSQVFFSGGSAKNTYIIQALQAELMVPCQAWNPTGFLAMSLPPQQMTDIEQVAPQLAVAVGTAVAAF
jgi:type IV pilus assembly protein PilM